MKFATPITISTILSATIIAGIAAFFHWQPHYIGENCAMYLDCGRLLLSGQTPYVDFIDLNPPLIMYLACLPVFIANQLHLSPVDIFHILILLAISLSYIITLRVCLKLQTKKPYDAFFLLPLAFALSNLPLLFCFGERDHLIILAFVPFFLLRFSRFQNEEATENIASRLVQVSIALAAGLAFSLKPQSAIVLLFFELYFLLTRRKTYFKHHADLLAFVVPPVIYACSFCLLPQSAREAYFDWLMPMMMSAYRAYDIPLGQAALLYSYMGQLLRSAFFVLMLVILAALSAKKSNLNLSLCLFSSGAYILYLMQSKGWSYQTIELSTASFLLSAALIPFYLHFLLAKAGLKLSLEKTQFLQIMLMLIISPCIALDSSTNGLALQDCNQFIKQYTLQGEPVLIIASAVSPAYPSLLLSERINASRYLWSAPLVMREYMQAHNTNLRASPGQKTEGQIVDELASDIEKHKPKLVFIEYNPVLGPNLLDITAANGLLNKLTGYKQLGLCNRFVAFLYTGKTEADGQDKNKSTIKEPQIKTRAWINQTEKYRLACLAIASLDRDLYFSPSATIYLKRGQAYTRFRMYQQAASDFIKALQLQPQNSKACCCLGLAHLHQLHYAEAKIAFEQALQINGAAESNLAHAALAYTLMQQGDGRRAQLEAQEVVLQQADTRAEDGAEGKSQAAEASVLVHCVRAALQRTTGNLEKARRETDAAIKSNPESAYGYLEEAKNLEQQKSFIKMLASANKALTIDYGLAEAHKCRGRALKAANQAGWEQELIIGNCLESKD